MGAATRTGVRPRLRVHLPQRLAGLDRNHRRHPDPQPPNPVRGRRRGTPLRTRGRPRHRQAQAARLHHIPQVSRRIARLGRSRAPPPIAASPQPDNTDRSTRRSGGPTCPSAQRHPHNPGSTRSTQAPARRPKVLERRDLAERPLRRECHKRIPFRSRFPLRRSYQPWHSPDWAARPDVVTTFLTRSRLGRSRAPPPIAASPQPDNTDRSTRRSGGPTCPSAQRHPHNPGSTRSTQAPARRPKVLERRDLAERPLRRECHKRIPFRSRFPLRRSYQPWHSPDWAARPDVVTTFLTRSRASLRSAVRLRVSSLRCGPLRRTAGPIGRTGVAVPRPPDPGQLGPASEASRAHPRRCAIEQARPLTLRLLTRMRLIIRGTGYDW
jgi:hypothetical protein